MPDSQHHHRAFWDHFDNAVWFAYSPHGNKALSPGSKSFRFPMTSILSAAFALECAANCCIESLSVSPEVHKKLDWLPTLKKYQVFFEHSRPGEQFDPDTSDFKAMKELVEVRNALAHPRTEIEEMTETGFLSRPKSPKKPLPLLQISPSYRQWTKHSAVKVLQASASFYSNFFLDVCGKNPPEVREMLLMTVNKAGKKISMKSIGPMEADILLATREWKLDMRFFPNFYHNTKLVA